MCLSVVFGLDQVAPVGALLHDLEGFRSGGRLRLWRTAPAAPLPDDWQGLIDWGGARRWLTAADDGVVGCAFDATYARGQCQAPDGNALLGEFQQRLRAAFDPQGILNPELGRADVAA